MMVYESPMKACCLVRDQETIINGVKNNKVAIEFLVFILTILCMKKFLTIAETRHYEKSKACYFLATHCGCYIAFVF